VRIGAHVRAPGGLRTAAEAAREVGAEAVQLFVSNPRSWAGPRLERAEAFGVAWREAGVGPLFVHAPYLVNVASPNPQFLARSLELCRRSVAACGAIGSDGFVVHAGSGGPGEPVEARERAAALLRAVLAETPETTRLLVELMAGTAGAVASTLQEAAALFEAVDDERLGLCLDTCHLFAAGYALDEPTGVDACFEELHATGLADRLRLVHANDARFGLGSRRDRHEVIGEGRIGLEGFSAILARPEVRDLAVVVETPASGERRRVELQTLRSLAPDQGSSSARGPSW
jgi:deoxyribonuclease-4